MCDLIVALPDATKGNKVLFGKNSDRPAGECQVLFFGEARKSSPSRHVQCSYVSVPDDQDTLATLGCRPYWCWGYETGINEAGVVGGNAAVFTKSLYLAENQTEPGLTGMGLLRFGLERGRTAEAAVDAIVKLLQKYGQWGSAVRGEDHNSGSYDNSFLLADSKEAWVLETSANRWIAERITDGVRSISNQPTIRTKWTTASPDLRDYAQQKDWWQSEDGEFDFAYVYSDHERYSRQVSHIRWQRTRQLLRESQGMLTAASFMRILRDHYEDTFLEGPQFHQFLPDFHTVCMHDSPNKFTWGNTATSVVAELDPEGKRAPVFWVAFLPPCTSIYTAFPFTLCLPDMVTKVGTAGMEVSQPAGAPVDQFEASSLWWRLHRVLEETAKEPTARPLQIRKLFDPLESQHAEAMKELLDSDSDNLEEKWNQILESHIERVMTVISRIEHEWHLE